MYQKHYDDTSLLPSRAAQLSLAAKQGCRASRDQTAIDNADRSHRSEREREKEKEGQGEEGAKKHNLRHTAGLKRTAVTMTE